MASEEEEETTTEEEAESEEEASDEEMTPEQRDKALVKVEELENKLAVKKAELGVDVDETADPTPGAVTEDTPKTTKKASAKESLPLISPGSWATFADTDTVEEQGGTPGAIVRVVEVQSKRVQGGDSDLSPRDHVIQEPDAQIIVAERGSGSREFVVTREDLENIGTERSDVLPVG